MLAKKVILLLVVFFSVKVNGITKAYLDSLIKVTNSRVNPEEKLNALYTLSFEYGFVEPRKGITYGFECLRMAIEQNNLLFQIHANNGIANCYETMSDFDSAKYYHRLSYEAALKTGEPSRIALTSFNMALCTKQLGDYRTALAEYLQAYRIMERGSSYNPRIHFYMGEIYMRIGEYDEAEYHSRTGIKKCEQFGQNQITMYFHANLAKCLMKRDKADSALAILYSSWNEFKSQTDEMGIALCLNSFGKIYKEKKEFNKAKDYFLEELIFQKKAGNLNGLLLAYAEVASCLSCISPQDKVKIKSYLNLSIHTAALVKENSDVLLEWYRSLSETQQAIGDFEQALINHKRYFQLYDSLMDREKMHQMLELQTKFETEKKESQIKILRQSDVVKSLELKSKEQAINKRNYFIVFGLIFFLMLVILTYVYTQKQKQHSAYEKNLAIKTTEERERIRMAKDIHDDLGSGLSKINFLSELISADSALPPDAKETTKSISETAQKLIVNMRDLIWALDPGNVSLGGLIARLREYSFDYLEDFPAQLTFEAPDDIPETSVTKEAYRSILMTVKESLNNIVKHSNAKSVFVNIQLTERVLSINVADDGKGINEGKIDGNGLKNMVSRIDSIGGSVKIESERGTIITIRVPLNNILEK